MSLDETGAEFFVPAPTGRGFELVLECVEHLLVLGDLNVDVSAIEPRTFDGPERLHRVCGVRDGGVRFGDSLLVNGRAL